jgi:hypothetical protein
VHLQSVMYSDMIAHESQRGAELPQAHRLGERILCIAALKRNRHQCRQSHSRISGATDPNRSLHRGADAV